MISLRTCLELIQIIENYTQAEVDRILHVFDMKFIIIPPDPNMSKAKKANFILEKLKNPLEHGPFGNSFQLDLLQYVVDTFYRKQDIKRYEGLLDFGLTDVPFEDLFSDKHKFLSNALKRDGYIVKGQDIRKQLPEEIEEAKTETELDTLLAKFGFLRSKGHLDQARSSHSLGNWAGANAQFRTFIESLLMEISTMLLPDDPCPNASSAIQLLANTASPPFLRAELNEIAHPGCNKPYVEGLFKRLHPEGNHPGLSSEADSSFRYHSIIVFSHYLLKRLENY